MESFVHSVVYPRQDIDPWLVRSVARLATVVGGPLFLLTVIAHPARDGHHIAANAGWYIFTHTMEAISLLVLTVGLAGFLALGTRRLRPGELASILTALVGTMLWFGLIVYDGSHNPATAMYAPDRVHTSADVDFEGGTIVLAANIVFPLGYVLLAVLLARHGRRWTGVLLGSGGVVYALGGTVSLFGFGPHSTATSIVEIVGATGLALGYVLLGRRGVDGTVVTADAQVNSRAMT
ncbi:hypothetical protein [Asanoa iriomotensis]|uniref:DUF4386 family protein n=1 Tax=Asanoa iriomotensis TaxID=234613 RepID=A0ABQ4C3I0_9ACTN|nr:hypothetical protein [Asanoa iriomotensis]GIF56830.1 hypothetical protein Air01nite_29250 [Asanoa iriomotensis]